MNRQNAIGACIFCCVGLGIVGAAHAQDNEAAVPVGQATPSASVAGSSALASNAGEDRNNVLTEIIVTAVRRRSESVQAVPVAVTSLGAAALERNNIANIAELGRLAPNVVIRRSTSTANQANIFLRGFGNGSNDPAIDPPIAIYVDGIYQPIGAGTSFDAYSVESIEVERGPQGTLLGKNASSGAISVNSRRPTGQWGGGAEAIYERFDYKAIKGRVDIPVLPDVLAVNASLVYKDGGDYIRGAQFGNKRIFGGEKGVAARIGILFTPAPNFDLLIQMNGQNTDNSPSGQRDFGSLPQDGPYQAPSLSCALFQLCTPSTRYVTDSTVNHRSRSNDRQISSTANLRLTPFTITSVTGYKKVNDAAFSDVDGTVAPVASQLGSEVNYHQFSQELRIASAQNGGLDLGGHLDWVVGAFYSNFKYDAPFTIEILGNVLTNFQKSRTKSTALFGHFVYNFNDHLNISVGLRQTWDDKTHTYRNTGDPRTFVDDPLNFKKFSKEAGLQYKFNSRQMVYFRYAEGYRNGGYQGLPPENAQVPYQPETVKSYEFGVKADFLDRRLRANLALFQNDYQDLQRTTIAAIPVFPFTAQLINNAANARVRGIELETTVVPIDALTLSLSATYLQPKYKNYIASIISGVPPTDLSDFPFPYSSKYTLRFAPQYVAELGSAGKLTLSGDLTYATSYYTSEIPFPLSRVRPLALLNASVKWDDPSDHYYIQLYGSNLTNRHYLQQFTSTPTPPGSLSFFSFGQDAKPATYGVRLGFKF
jgi:iron complex outermembrane receptor protein